MSFVWKAPQRLRSPEQVAREVHEVSLGRGLDELATVMALMCIAVESDFWCPWNAKDPSSQKYPHDSQSDDGRSVGYFQQQNGRPGEVVTGSDNWWGPMADRMDLKRSANTFLERLTDNYRDARDNPVLAGQFVQNVQRSAFPDRYAQEWGMAWDLLRRALDQPKQPETPVPDNRPDFNEFPIWSSNNSPRRFIEDIDAIFLHTSEGFVGDDAAAEGLSKWYQNANGVSYHYAVSQASDGGVTVVDNVDTDRYSWSVLSANNRSINLCFAGTRAAWTRDEWLSKFGNAIDVAAYLAVQDCKKYGIPTKVIAPPYTGRLPGISDHRYVTEVLKDGTHWDVGDGFPWDVFTAAVDKYSGKQAPPVPPKPGPKVFPEDWTDRDLNVEILRQQRGYNLDGWPQLGGRTLVDAVAAIGEKLGIEGCYDVKAADRGES